MKQVYESDIVLGEKYRDKDTDLVGTATSLHFYRNACERVVLLYVHKGDARELSADAVDLVRVSTGGEVTSEKPGGPGRSMPSRR